MIFNKFSSSTHQFCILPPKHQFCWSTLKLCDFCCEIPSICIQFAVEVSFSINLIFSIRFKSKKTNIHSIHNTRAKWISLDTHIYISRAKRYEQKNRTYIMQCTGLTDFSICYEHCFQCHKAETKQRQHKTASTHQTRHTVRESFVYEQWMGHHKTATTAATAATAAAVKHIEQTLKALVSEIKTQKSTYTFACTLTCAHRSTHTHIRSKKKHHNHLQHRTILSVPVPCVCIYGH